MSVRVRQRAPSITAPPQQESRSIPIHRARSRTLPATLSTSPSYPPGSTDPNDVAPEVQTPPPTGNPSAEQRKSASLPLLPGRRVGSSSHRLVHPFHVTGYMSVPPYDQEVRQDRSPAPLEAAPLSTAMRTRPRRHTISDRLQHEYFLTSRRRSRGRRYSHLMEEIDARGEQGMSTTTVQEGEEDEVRTTTHQGDDATQKEREQEHVEYRIYEDPETVDILEVADEEVSTAANLSNISSAIAVP